ncbi:flavin-containing monooxygenase [Novosphingobium piscinae]|uniref:NAD(P)/FAD-dependent oxidoreductase n=1 Tax=Novosphingobium piscinae TaxID=1507448 RepID=A0A7X1KQA0_9SPHN|nr:NAD(P)/FAD-dependent oxidoreductase [Novosphingobium piscinae]MBC2669539.1 NAD(P)/FAD-dependent oxidoreductase [Novosphingobium piscinae]
MVSGEQKPQFDVVVIGAGVTGIYQTYLLEQAGLSVCGIEAGADVGGTWFWNRYPGCRLDTESYAYGYFALKGIIPDWDWRERFAAQPEMLRYANRAADAMDVRRLYRFNTKVVAAHYQDEANVWTVNLDTSEVITCRFLISATGPLSATRMPDIVGIDLFKGESFHSSRWPVDDAGLPRDIDFAGKRVGIIGTGATGVQIIPIVAESAGELFVFQRSPNWCTPLGNTPISAEEMSVIKARFPSILEYVKITDTAFPYHRDRRKAIDVPAEEREAFFEELYNQPGYGIWLSGFRDLLVSKESNKFLADFIAGKIRQRVKDQTVAEKLIPKDHPFGGKRVPMETNYYEAFNKDNVRLVDIREAPIERITETGIQTADGFYELDVIIFATGFDAVTGSLDRIDIRGKSGRPLKEAWAEGPSTYLGLQARGFPNFFTLVGPHNGSAFCNVGVCGGLQAEWVTQMLIYLSAKGLTFSEPSQAAEEEWTESIYQEFSRTLLAEANAWWVRTTTKPDGTVVRRTLVHVGGGPEYRKRCEQVAYHDYAGFELA